MADSLRGWAGLKIYARLRGGSKNGSAFTATPTCLRSWFTVNSISSFVPGAASSADSVASAIIFFRVGDQVLLVAFPTCLPPR